MPDITPMEARAIASYTTADMQGDLRTGTEKLARTLVRIVNDDSTGVEWHHIFCAFAEECDKYSICRFFWDACAMLSRFIGFNAFAVVTMAGWFLAIQFLVEKAVSAGRALFAEIAGLFPELSASLDKAGPLLRAGTGMLMSVLPFGLGGVFAAALGIRQLTGGDRENPNEPVDPTRTGTTGAALRRFFRGTGPVLGKISEIFSKNGESVYDVEVGMLDFAITDPNPDPRSSAPGPNPGGASITNGGVMDRRTDQLWNFDSVGLVESSDGSFQFINPSRTGDRLRDTARGTNAPGELGVRHF